MNPNEFITRWQRSGGAELANSQSFLKELCTVLDVVHPEPTQADESQNVYVFEKAVQFNNGDGTFSTGRIDLYRQKCFILESKQGAERKAEEQAEALATVTRNRKHRKGTAARGTPQWAQAMKSPFHQAKRYAEPLPEWPPFLIVCDVGHCFDVYADFSGSGKNYSQFPDPQTCRIAMQSLTNEATREFLRTIWLDPHSLDPAKKSAKVTRELAERLAKLAMSLESRAEAGTKKTRGKTRKSPEQTIEDTQDRAHDVAQFLMRCLFTMFAEDVELLPKGSFVALLESLRDQPDQFVPMVEAVWKSMDQGGFSPVLRQKILQFNGGLFADCTALPLNADQLELLIEAAKANWAEVEPSIFGTLLERALNPVERHKLGAHYTPRAYVERLVMPTIMEPLRDEWDIVYATATALYNADKVADARKTVREFHEKLCHVRVLDPACGSGNFLYVALELMKKLEGEVTKAMADFGDRQKIFTTIDPHQFLGIEVNPRAAAIADLVLWIGYLQWHIRALGRESIAEPIIRKFDNIECRDAVLAWDSIERVIDENGRPVTRWDGRTTKTHPVTAEQIPDDTARVQELRYINASKAKWPQADYIVGNPPFIGNKRMVRLLGSAYCDALRSVYEAVPESADYVMYWWYSAATEIALKHSARFGLITTNSITQTFNARIVASLIAEPVSFGVVFAIPDHPWVDAEDGAAVRIAMTVGAAGAESGLLCRVVAEIDRGTDSTDVVLRSEVGLINAELRIGMGVHSITTLRSNERICGQGMKLVGDGFIDEAGLSTVPRNPITQQSVVRRYISPRDILNGKSGRTVIDFCGLAESDARAIHSAAFQRLVDTVRPHRSQNRRKSIREIW